MQNFQVGDRVAYSAAFLRNTGQFTGDVPQMRGVVVSLMPIGSSGRVLAKVKWQDGEVNGALTANLAKIGTRAMSAD